MADDDRNAAHRQRDFRMCRDTSLVVPASSIAAHESHTASARAQMVHPVRVWPSFFRACRSPKSQLSDLRVREYSSSRRKAEGADRVTSACSH